MKVIGIDFTSAPDRRKPVTAAEGTLTNGELVIEPVRCLASFKEFEEEIAAPGPWVAGIDFPFGQPSRLIRELGWPRPWNEYVRYVAAMGKDGFERAVRQYIKGQPYGEKHQLRATDKLAKSNSPMNLVRPPVGKMFFQGASRILFSGASIVPCAMNDGDRVIVEAYPALAAQALADTRNYKNDQQSKVEARRRIAGSLTGERCEEKYGLVVRMDSKVRQGLVDDPQGDLLDAVLCALQAAWSSLQPDYGVPETCDQLEGWIVDPALLDPPRPAAGRSRNSAQFLESELLARISMSPSICHGRPCIRGLRYPVEMILELLSSGMSSEEILEDYEDLEQEDILAALAFAARLSRVKRLHATA